MALHENLTAYEAEAISRVLNLADGHAHQSQNGPQHNIVSQLPLIFYRVEGSRQEIIEREFIETFFDAAGQHDATDFRTSLLTYSASVSTDIVMKLVAGRNCRLGLLEPTFDNIAMIAARSGVDVVPIREEELLPEPNVMHLLSLELDALMLVLPNNPTGTTLGKKAFETIVRACQANNIFLVVDFCYRFFEDMAWDQYAIAQDSGVRFVFIEDTGKTWPVLDMKASIMTCDSRTYDDLYSVHNDILLNVSPFILEVLRQYIASSLEHGMDSSITDLVRTNREFLRHKLSNTILAPANVESTISVEWLKIQGDCDAHTLWQEFAAKSVYLLPGDHFFWANPRRGEKHLRVALLRDPLMFRDAMKIIEITLRERDALSSK